MNRYEMARSLLEKGQFFKIVCGAGNEDPVEVRRLSMIYTLAGASAIDISANEEIVKSAVEGIMNAVRLAPELGIKIGIRPFICVSVGIRGDPHIRKARIVQDLCELCGLCKDACEQGAIQESISVIEQKCIGCGKCAEICLSGAIEFYDKRVELDKILPKCLEIGAEMIELHAVTDDDAAVMNDWKIINALNPDNYISMCLDRSLLSDRHLINRIQDGYEITGEKLIIQADGAPMSGGSDDYNTTLQAIAISDIVQKSGIPVKILTSGGTNSKSRELADLCGVKIHGVSIGTFARKLVRQYIEHDSFEHDISLIQKAVSVARHLVDSSIGKSK